MTATASMVKARAEVRLITARTDYRYFRGQWRQYYLDFGNYTEALTRALVARERWVTLHELLTDPDLVALRANGLDADDLALLAGGAA
jgi:hypothetical protein